MSQMAEFAAGGRRAWTTSRTVAVEGGACVGRVQGRLKVTCAPARDMEAYRAELRVNITGKGVSPWKAGTLELLPQPFVYYWGTHKFVLASWVPLEAKEGRVMAMDQPTLTWPTQSETFMRTTWRP